jgi:hypothetical protein
MSVDARWQIHHRGPVMSLEAVVELDGEIIAAGRVALASG